MRKTIIRKEPRSPARRGPRRDPQTHNDMVQKHHPKTHVPRFYTKEFPLNEDNYIQSHNPQFI